MRGVRTSLLKCRPLLTASCCEVKAFRTIRTRPILSVNRSVYRFTTSASIAEGLVATRQGALTSESETRLLPLVPSITNSADDDELALLEHLVTGLATWNMISRVLQRPEKECQRLWIDKSPLKRKHVEAQDKARLETIVNDRWSKRAQSSNTRISINAGSDHASTTEHLQQLLTAAGRDALDQGLYFSEVYHGSFEVELMRTPVLTWQDWEQIARDEFDTRYDPTLIRYCYYELLKKREVWTPLEDAVLMQSVVQEGGPYRGDKVWSAVVLHLRGQAQKLHFLKPESPEASKRQPMGKVRRVRSIRECQERWKALDVSTSGQDWDQDEVNRFWARWLEFRRGDSNLADEALESFSATPTALLDGGSNALTLPSPLDIHPIWEAIAAGIPSRHARDCELYFERSTAYLQAFGAEYRNTKEFEARVVALAHKMVGRGVSRAWTLKMDKKLMKLGLEREISNQGPTKVSWREVADELGNGMTSPLCRSRYSYLKERERVNINRRSASAESAKATLSTDSESSTGRIKTAYWTAQESRLLKQGVERYGTNQWTLIQREFLPRRQISSIRDRWRREYAITSRGHFSTQEIKLLEKAVHRYGEKDQWDKVALEVPGRSLEQCREAWKTLMSHFYFHGRDHPAIASSRSKEIDNTDSMTATPENIGDNDLDQEPVDPFERKRQRERQRLLQLGQQQSQDIQTRDQSEGSLGPKSRSTGLRPYITWSLQDDDLLKKAVDRFGLNDWKNVSFFVPGRTGPQCRTRYRQKFAPGLLPVVWSDKEVTRLLETVQEMKSKQEYLNEQNDSQKILAADGNTVRSTDWREIQKRFPGRTAKDCRERYLRFQRAFMWSL